MAVRQRPINLRSDTVTVPTERMRRAMYEAEVGDDVYGEDPTVNRLEELAAAMLGKEAAVFVCSGTMGNEVALLTHVRRGDEVILEAESHINYYEVGGISALAGAQPRPVPGVNGILTVEAFEAALRPENIHYPRTTLLCLENTHNRGGGTVMTPAQTDALCAAAHAHGLKVHLDGARLFNAAVYLETDPRELTAGVDSVQVCLSKGLCCPVGSLLAGARDFIAEARRYRKQVGGGLRQAGFLAAPAIVALEEMVDRLAEDHANARLLAEALAALPGVKIDLATVQTNIVCFNVADAEAWIDALEARGILGNVFGPDKIRLTTHKDVSRADIEQTIRACAEVAQVAKRTPS